jgi:hypothetical protein
VGRVDGGRGPAAGEFVLAEGLHSVGGQVPQGNRPRSANRPAGPAGSRPPSRRRRSDVADDTVRPCGLTASRARRRA